MKVRSKLLTSVVLLLCVVFSRVLLAEHRNTGQSITVDNDVEISRDGHKHQKRDRMMDVWTKDSIHQKHFGENSIANVSSDTWKIEAVDAPKYFTAFYSRAIAVDASNHPHIAYGGEHLYYAYYDGSTWNYQTVDSSPNVGDDASIALDTSGKVHISYHDGTNHNLKYATNASDVPATPTPFQTPTPTPIATPTGTPEPTPVPPCESENITADSKRVEVVVGSSASETITIICDDGTPVEGEQITWKIKKGKKNFTITPKSAITDADGQEVFTITGVKKGNANVEFKSGDLKVMVKVKIKLGKKGRD